ncbi:MAG: ATP synthase F0 subunit B [Verrucomicrobiota bacterium]
MFTLLALAAESHDSAVAEMLGKFGVNWPNFIASCINFLLVICVLKRYAFGPIQAMLEQRRERIAEGEEKLKLIEQQLADSEQTTAAAIAKAHAEAVRMLQEAKLGAAAFTEQKAQEAIAQAQQILIKAEAAAKADRERLGIELKREFGRLVASTTAQVAGKVLTPDDQRRLSEAALAEVEA